MQKLEVLSFPSDRKQQKTNENVFVNEKEEAALKKWVIRFLWHFLWEGMVPNLPGTQVLSTLDPVKGEGNCWGFHLGSWLFVCFIYVKAVPIIHDHLETHSPYCRCTYILCYF